MPASSRNGFRSCICKTLQLISLPSNVFSVIVNFKYLHAQKAVYVKLPFY